MGNTFYKCISRDCFQENKVIDTNFDNYGIYGDHDFSRCKDALNALITVPEKFPDLPISLFVYMLAYINGIGCADGTICAEMDLIKTPKKKYVYEITDLVNAKCCKETVTRKQLLGLQDALKDVHSYVNNGSVIQEYVAEYVRSKYFPELPSRLKSYFLFDRYEAAENYIKNWKQNYIIVKAEIIEKEYLESFDIDVWDDFNLNNLDYESMVKKIKDYWERRESIKTAEFLFKGKVKLMTLEK